MSWDLTICRFGGIPQERDEEGYFPSISLGSYRDVKKLLDSAMSMHWDEDGWGHISSPDFNIEFNLNMKEKDIRQIMLHIHDPEFAMHAVQELCKKCNLFAFDEQEGRFIDTENLKFEPVDDDDDEEDEDDVDWDEDQDEFSETVTRPQVKDLVYM